MRGTIGVTFAMSTIVGSLVMAAPAAADQGEYLRLMLPKYAYLNSEQLMREAAVACQITRSGRPASDAVAVVVKDLGVSVSAAGDIIAAALVHLPC